MYFKLKLNCIFRVTKDSSANVSSGLATPISSKGGSRKNGVPSDSDCSDHDGTPIPTNSYLHSPNSQTSPISDRLETSDRMSKEKQKFFRLSAFNADKKRDKKSAKSENNEDASKMEKKSIGKVAQRVTQSRVCKNVKSKDELTNSVKKDSINKKNGGVGAKVVKSKQNNIKKKSNKMESDSNCVNDIKKHKSPNRNKKVARSSSDSGSSDQDIDSTSNCDSDSSLQASETSSLNIKRSNMIFGSCLETKTFGTVAGITTNNKDDVWGFAAAAAEAKHNESNKSTADEIKQEDSNKGGEKGRPGFGQLKNLFDGLSHLFATPTLNRSRNTSSPNYNLTRRKKQKGESQKNENQSEITEPEDSQPEKVNNVEVAENLTKEKTIKIEKSDEIVESKTKSRKEMSIRKIPNPIKVPDITDEPKQMMTPSNLVKTAVNSKRHELERRKLLKSEAGLVGAVGFSQKATLEDVRTKKRNLIAEATQTNHPLSVPSNSNNQTGKIRLQNRTFFHFLLPYYSCFPFTSEILNYKMMNCVVYRIVFLNHVAYISG